MLLAGASAQQMPPSTTSAKDEQAAAQSASEEKTLTLGADLRVRSENWSNIIDFNHANDDVRQQMRYRIRAWMHLPITRLIDFRVGVADEFYQFLQPIRNLNYNEAVFDSFSLGISKLHWPALSMRVGRQDLARGEGFVLFDGTPGDGSR